MTEPSPYLAAIDHLRGEIAERQQLLTMANRKRELMSLHPFKWEFA